MKFMKRIKLFLQTDDYVKKKKFNFSKRKKERPFRSNDDISTLNKQSKSDFHEHDLNRLNFIKLILIEIDRSPPD